MKYYPKPFWPGHFDDSTWIGLVNSWIRWLWLRIGATVDFKLTPDPPHSIIHYFLMVGIHPRAGFNNRKWEAWATITFRTRSM